MPRRRRASQEPACTRRAATTRAAAPPRRCWAAGPLSSSRVQAACERAAPWPLFRSAAAVLPLNQYAADVSCVTAAATGPQRRCCAATLLSYRTAAQLYSGCCAAAAPPPVDHVPSRGCSCATKVSIRSSSLLTERTVTLELLNERRRAEERDSPRDP